MKRFRFVPTVIVSAWFAAAMTVNAQPVGTVDDRRDAIAIVNVQVIPMDGERVVPAQTVLVRAGRIEAVGDADRMVAPADAMVIDGAGRYLLPGLTDAHVHLATDMPWAPARADFGDAPLYLANGVTTVINLGGSARELDWRRRVASGELPGPTIYTSGEFVNEPRMRTPEDVEEAVAAQARDGYDLIKFRERPDTTVGLSLGSYRRMMDAARRAGLPLVGHAPINLGIDAALDAHQSLAHVNMLSNVYFLPLAAHSRTLLTTAMALAVLALLTLWERAARRLRRRQKAAAGSTALTAVRRLVTLATVLGWVVAILLALVLPGGPFFDSFLLRALLSAATVLLAGSVASAAVRLPALLRAPTLPSGSLRLCLAVVTGIVLATTLVMFWVPVAWRSSGRGIAALAGRLHDAGVSVQSTLGVYETLESSTRGRLAESPAIDFLHPATRQLWRRLPRSGLPGYRLPAFTRELVRALHQAGVSIVAGTDAMGVPLVVPGVSLQRELELLVASGLRPYEAIYAATRAPAAFLQKTEEFGTIATGRRADLLLLEQNPLDDVRHAAHPLGVIARGSWFSRADLDRMLQALRAES